MRARSLVIVQGATLLAAATWSPAADSPQWRGAERNGVTAEAELAREWPTGGPPVAWQIDDLGEGYGAVSVVGDRLYVQGTRGSQSVVFARGTSDGAPVWSRELGRKLIQDKGNGPRSTPTFDGGVLYVLNGMGELAALEASDGSVRWQFNMLERFGSPNPRWGISESPLVDGERLYVMPGGRQGAVVALEKGSGETVWRSSQLGDEASYSSLIAVDVGGLRALVGFTQQAGVGLAADDGRLLWRYGRAANDVANAATPIYAHGLAFYTSSYGIGGGAVRITRSGPSGQAAVESEEAYFAPRLQNHHGGVVLIDRHLFGFFGQALSCASFETGELLWRARSVGKGSLTAAGGLLFLLGENHEVGVAAASVEGYDERGRFEIEDHGWPSWAHPVVSGGRLYIRNQHQLTAYDVSAAVASTSAEGAE